MKTPTFYFLGLLLMVACRKDIATMPCTNPLDPACVNYHPCNAVQPVTADFEMWYGDYIGNNWVVQDSVFPPGYILFKAKLNGAQYQWTLGLDTEYVQQDYRSFGPRTFNDTSFYKTYYNTLTVSKTPNLMCYPNEKAIASLTRKITIRRPSQLLTSGMFKVKFETDKDSTIIQIKTWEKTSMGIIDTLAENSGSRYLIGFRGLKKDTISSGTYSQNCFYTDKYIRFGDHHTLDEPSNGFIQVDPFNVQISGEYQTSLPPEYQTVRYKFKGRKL